MFYFLLLRIKELIMDETNESVQVKRKWTVAQIENGYVIKDENTSQIWIANMPSDLGAIIESLAAHENKAA